MDLLNTIMQWVVAPVAAFVVWLHSRVQIHATDIAVIKAVQAANKEAHDREFKEMKANFVQVIEKLDNIEAHLRK